eukprot:6003-Eustigmatos_ZCMA.PRE.1
MLAGGASSQCTPAMNTPPQTDKRDGENATNRDTDHPPHIYDRTRTPPAPFESPASGRVGPHIRGARLDS